MAAPHALYDGFATLPAKIPMTEFRRRILCLLGGGFWTFVLSALLLVAATVMGAPSVLEKSFPSIDGLIVKVREAAPGNQEGPLQIICYLKHKPTGDTVIAALLEMDQNMGHIIKSLRDRNQFAGDELETIAFTPPAGSVKAKEMLLVGIGDEEHLSLATMSRVGTVALREAVRLKASSVSFAAAVKDQGVNKMDAGEVAGSVIESVLLAYDTEKKLQKEGLATEFALHQWIYEAGPAYFQSTVNHVRDAVSHANAEITRRSASPFSTSRVE
jgi:hypothetical protein